MASASSSTMSLKPPELLHDGVSREGQGDAERTHLKTFLVLAKLLICSRTTSMPLSSDALSFGEAMLARRPHSAARCEKEMPCALPELHHPFAMLICRALTSRTLLRKPSP